MGPLAQAPLRSHRPTGACMNRVSLTWPTGRVKDTGKVQPDLGSDQVSETLLTRYQPATPAKNILTA